MVELIYDGCDEEDDACCVGHAREVRLLSCPVHLQPQEPGHDQRGRGNDDGAGLGIVVQHRTSLEEKRGGKIVTLGLCMVLRLG